ncbi:MAG TPA: leucyl aminopeptidase [Vicinamibacterales bacterium]|nr:leucyl aminopeptidase [Vicinamibacterales bacterium]
MQPAYEIPECTISASKPSDIDADVVVIPVFQDDPSDRDVWDAACGGDILASYERGEFSAKPCEQLSAQPSGWRARRLLLVGVGPRDAFCSERARRAGACAALTSRLQRRARVGVVVPEGWRDDAIESLVEGLMLGNYDNGRHKSKPDGRFFISRVEIASAGDAAEAVARGQRVAEAANAARLLINEPGNHLNPSELVARAQALLALPNVTTEILDERRLEELGMGLLLGVGQGSASPPRLLVARYEPAGAPKSPVLALVGKGITFDTGGISIKPADGLERMKDDMAGGATVVAALRAIALEQLPLRVMVLVPAAENMLSGGAMRPGDVLRGASGLTVEVNNTDAEGRLILGDALWHATQLGATHIIDVATLTGAIVVALGKTTTGLFGTDGWREVVQAAANRAGEKVWPMPLFEDYREPLKSEIADLLNSPGRAGGAVTAAMFLKEFVGTAAWAHLDIAGTAWAEDARPWTVKGATGVMTRTLVEVARSRGRNWP